MTSSKTQPVFVWCCVILAATSLHHSLAGVTRKAQQTESGAIDSTPKGKQPRREIRDRQLQAGISGGAVVGVIMQSQQWRKQSIVSKEARRDFTNDGNIVQPGKDPSKGAGGDFGLGDAKSAKDPSKDAGGDFSLGDAKSAKDPSKDARGDFSLGDAKSAKDPSKDARGDFSLGDAKSATDPSKDARGDFSLGDVEIAKDPPNDAWGDLIVSGSREEPEKDSFKDTSRDFVTGNSVKTAKDGARTTRLSGKKLGHVIDRNVSITKDREGSNQKALGGSKRDSNSHHARQEEDGALFAPGAVSDGTRIDHSKVQRVEGEEEAGMRRGRGMGMGTEKSSGSIQPHTPSHYRPTPRTSSPAEMKAGLEFAQRLTVSGEDPNSEERPSLPQQTSSPSPSRGQRGTGSISSRPELWRVHSATFGRAPERGQHSLLLPPPTLSRPLRIWKSQLHFSAPSQSVWKSAKSPLPPVADGYRVFNSESPPPPLTAFPSSPQNQGVWKSSSLPFVSNSERSSLSPLSLPPRDTEWKSSLSSPLIFLKSAERGSSNPLVFSDGKKVRKTSLFSPISFVKNSDGKSLSSFAFSDRKTVLKSFTQPEDTESKFIPQTTLPSKAIKASSSSSSLPLPDRNTEWKSFAPLAPSHHSQSKPSPEINRPSEPIKVSTGQRAHPAGAHNDQFFSRDPSSNFKADDHSVTIPGLFAPFSTALFPAAKMTATEGRGTMEGVRRGSRRRRRAVNNDTVVVDVANGDSVGGITVAAGEVTVNKNDGTVMGDVGKDTVHKTEQAVGVDETEQTGDVNQAETTVDVLDSVNSTVATVKTTVTTTSENNDVTAVRNTVTQTTVSPTSSPSTGSHVTSSTDAPTTLSTTTVPTSQSSKTTSKAYPSSTTPSTQSTQTEPSSSKGTTTKRPPTAPQTSLSKEVLSSSSTSTTSSPTSPSSSTKTPVPITTAAILSDRTSKAKATESVAGVSTDTSPTTTTEPSTKVPKVLSPVATTKFSRRESDVSSGTTVTEEPTTATAKTSSATITNSGITVPNSPAEVSGKTLAVPVTDTSAGASNSNSSAATVTDSQAKMTESSVISATDDNDLKSGGAKDPDNVNNSSKPKTRSRSRPDPPAVHESAAEATTEKVTPVSVTTEKVTSVGVTTEKMTSVRSDDSVTTTEKSRISVSSGKRKSGGGWTSGENSVSPTDSSNKRTIRSTDAASSDTPTPPGTEADSTSSTSKTTQPSATSSMSTKAATTVSDTTTISAESQTTKTPKEPNTTSSPDPPTSTPVSPEDLFGSSWTADPKPEGEPDPEPGYGRNKMGMGGVGEEDESAEEPVSEPGPDWDNAKMVWKEAWEFHLYIFGCLFGLLGLYVLVCVIRLWRIHRLLSRRYFVSLNLLMLLLCATRAVYLMLDGYNSHGTFHPSLDYFFYSISFPCLTSAFSIQLYALLQATKMQFLPPTIQKMSLLMTIVVVHFAISIATDVVVGMYAGMEIMLFVCQLFFILWGLFLFFGYAYIFRRLYVHAVKRQKNVVQNNGSVYGGGGGLAKPKARFTLSVAVTVTMLTAVLGLVTVALEVYAVVGVYKTFSNDRPQPWPWYFYHTALRLVEFLMCATMGYVASQPFRYRRREQSCCCPVLCAPCAEICYCGNDANRSEAQAGWSELDQHQLRISIDRGQPVGVGYHHDGYHSNGNALRGSKNSQKGGGGGGEVTKTRIYFSDHDDVMPIVTSQPRSRPTSTTSDTMIDGENATLSTRGSPSVSYQGSGGVNSPVRRPSQSPSERDFNSSRSAASPPRSTLPSATSTPARAWNGVVNTAYIPTSDEPHSPPGPRSPLSLKSRKGSSASSEFFLAPSVSLADSMASELEKAFRSMHQDISLGGASSPLGQTPSLHSLNTAHPQQQDLEGVPMGSLRRSRSATGRSSFVEAEPLQTVEKADEPKTRKGAGTDRKGVEPVRKGAEHEPDGAWHQKLFRSRSDNSGGIRTKDVGSGGTYMSLLDIEKQQQGEQPTGAPSSSPSALAGSVQTESPRHTVTCVDGGAGYRSSDNSRLSDDAPVLTDTVKNHAANSGDDCSDKVGGRHVDSIVSSPSPVSDVTNVNGVIVTSPRPPYCTVIPIRSVPRDRSDCVRSGDSGSGSILQGSKPQPSSSAITNSSPVSHSTSVSVTPRGMNSPGSSTSPLTPGGLSGMNSSKGMLGYCMDDSDDIEV